MNTHRAAISRCGPMAHLQGQRHPLRPGSATPARHVGKRLHDLLNIAGRIFYETHFAPLLRMQGFFNEVALDFVTQKAIVLPALVNAAERRDASMVHLVPE